MEAYAFLPAELPPLWVKQLIYSEKVLARRLPLTVGEAKSYGEGKKRAKQALVKPLRDCSGGFRVRLWWRQYKYVVHDERQHDQHHHDDKHYQFHHDQYRDDDSLKRI
jgi:hypothetical protein